MAVTFVDFLQRKFASRDIVQDLLPEGGMLCISAPPKTGKTLLALQLASAIADPATNHFLSFPVVEHGKVLFLQLDMPPAKFQQHIQGLQAEGVPMNSPALLAETRDDLREAGCYPFEIVGGGYAHLQGLVRSFSPRTVIVDTLRDVFGGDENDSGAMRNMLTQLRDATAGSALVLICHPRKPHALNPGTLISNLRGSSYLAGTTDGVMALEKDKVGWETRSASGGMKLFRQGPLWVMADPLEEMAETILRTNPGMSDRRAAEKLATLDGGRKGREAYRWFIRKAREGSASALSTFQSAPVADPSDSM